MRSSKEKNETCKSDRTSQTSSKERDWRERLEKRTHEPTEATAQPSTRSPPISQVNARPGARSDKLAREGKDEEAGGKTSSCGGVDGEDAGRVGDLLELHTDIEDCGGGRVSLDGKGQEEGESKRGMLRRGKEEREERGKRRPTEDDDTQSSNADPRRPREDHLRDEEDDEAQENADPGHESIDEFPYKRRSYHACDADEGEETDGEAAVRVDVAEEEGRTCPEARKDDRRGERDDAGLNENRLRDEVLEEELSERKCEVVQKERRTLTMVRRIS